MILPMLLILSCQNSQTRQQTIDGIESATTDGSVIQDGGNSTSSQPKTELPPVVKSAKVIRKMGIILGPGASHAYAHIGFLKALAEEKLPVAHIAGIEWGALPAYFFAHEGMGHEVEWKMSRLNPEELFEKNFFNTGKAQFQSRKFLDELEKITKGEVVQTSKVKFICPLLQVSTQRLLLNTQGAAKDVLSHCLSFPPFKMPNRDLYADTLNIEVLAQAMRMRGVDFILYVNPTDGLFLDDFEDESNTKLLWAQTLSYNRSRNFVGVNLVIRPKLSATKLTEFSKKKTLINESYSQSKKSLKELAKTYQFQ